jgi:RND family efflux transporter MFP subunit
VTGRRVLYIVGTAAVCAAGLFVWLLAHRRDAADARERDERRREQERGPEVPVVAVEPAPPTRTIVLPGDVRPWRTATLYARTSGYLVDLRVDRGDRVKRGQILGIVSTPETDQQLAPLIANVAARKMIADRLRALVPKGVAAQADLDRADADLTAARSDADRLRALRGENDIRAPFDGVVTRRYVDIGALMPAPTGSTQTAQPLVDVVDLSRVRVVVYLGQRDATGVHVGDAIEIARDIDPAQRMAAQVSRIPQELDLRTRTMWVEADIANERGALYPGLFVTVTLHVPAPPGVMIPSDAIAIIDGKPTVATVRDGRVALAAIEIADDDGRTARVVRGLEHGQWIAARLGDEIADGRRVRPVKPQPASGAQACADGRPPPPSGEPCGGL